MIPHPNHLQDSGAEGREQLDLAWNDWLTRVETQSGRDVHNLDSAWIEFCNGQTASDYALEVVARAGEVS